MVMLEGQLKEINHSSQIECTMCVYMQDKNELLRSTYTRNIYFNTQSYHIKIFRNKVKAT